jgi:hypothetical protein
VGPAAKILAAFAALCGAAACVSLVGLSGGEALPDAGDARDELHVDAGPVDPCHHHVPPLPPAIPDDPAGDIGALTVAISAVSIRGALDGGAATGYDLDGVCTCFADPHTAHDGGSACIPPDGGGGGVSLCDEDGGDDVQFAKLLAPYPGYFTGGGTIGGATLLLRITQYNGRANDASVFVGFIPSAGIYDITGCERDAGVDAGSPPYEPSGRACDTWTVDPANVLPGTTEPTSFLPGYVTDHTLVLPASAKPVTLMIGGAPIPVQSTELTARLVPVDDQLVPLSPEPDVGTLFRLENGLLGGRVATGDVLRGFAISQAVTGTGPLCGPDALFPVLKSKFLCPNADVVSDMTLDFTDKICDAMSVSVSFRAQPGRMGEARTAETVGCKSVDDPDVVQLFDCNVSP